MRIFDYQDHGFAGTMQLSVSKDYTGMFYAFNLVTFSSYWLGKCLVTVVVSGGVYVASSWNRSQRAKRDEIFRVQNETFRVQLIISRVFSQL